VKKAFVAIVLLVLFSSCEIDTGTPERGKSTPAASAPATRVQENFRPFLKDGDKPFRIALVQSGEFYAYVEVFQAILEGLQIMGWIPDTPLPDVLGVSALDLTMKELFENLQTYPYDRHLVFPPELFFDFNWEDVPEDDPAFSGLLSGTIDADLIISLGTGAGIVLSGAEEITIPVVVEGASDPVGSGIVPSVEDSGRDNLTASVDPEIYSRQIRLFHGLVQFERPGLIYTDTELGRSYAALSDAESLARELGFEIVAATNVMEDPPDERDIPRAEEMYLRALKELAPRVDAVYLSFQAGLTLENLPAVMEIVEQHRLPTFAMEGSEFVRGGVLFGMSISEIRTMGLYNAGKIVRILHGRLPRAQDQMYEQVPHIAVNLEGARRIGFDIPMDVFPSIDEIYLEVE
jgi:ABC-type uncharacterized transport system substrate-binding protein